MCARERRIGWGTGAGTGCAAGTGPRGHYGGPGRQPLVHGGRGPHRADHLHKQRDPWIVFGPSVLHGGAILAILCLIIGAKLAGDANSGLSSQTTPIATRSREG